MNILGFKIEGNELSFLGFAVLVAYGPRVIRYFYGLYQSVMNEKKGG